MSSRRLTPRTPSFRKFDFFDKAVDGVRDTSLIGALISTASLGVMALLFFSELWAYLKVDTVSHMRVSGIHEIKETTVHLHITFPHLGCEELSLEVENIRGGQGVGMSAGRFVEARSPNKEELKLFKGATKDIAGSPTACTLQGDIAIARVGGMIHLKIFNFDRAGGDTLDHYIHDLSFGPPIPDVKHPLRGVYVDAPLNTARVSYTLKVVPTSITTRSGRTTKSFQYSTYSEYESKEILASKKDIRHTPGVHFAYDFTPVMVHREEESEGFFQFFTSSCAIIGGVFTMSGLLVGCIQNVKRTTKND